MTDVFAGAARSATRGALLALGLATLSAGAHAAPTPVAERAAAAEPVRQVEEGAAEALGDGSTCTKARRRLWVEGEGWIVRRITSCH